VKPAQGEPGAAGEATSAQINPGAPAEAKSDAGASAEAKSEAGTSAEAKGSIPPGGPAQTNAAQDAGAVAAGESAGTPQTGPPAAAPPAAPAVKKRAGPSSQAAMLHALALSQVRRGEAALEQGNADDALASFRAALENEPTIAVAFRGLGMAYAMQGHDAEALQAYDKYLRLSPKAPDAPEIRKSIRELRTRAKVGTAQE
jgi:tetratricopeptide (TPR) repeat protein